MCSMNLDSRQFPPLTWSDQKALCHMLAAWKALPTLDFVYNLELQSFLAACASIARETLTVTNTRIIANVAKTFPDRLIKTKGEDIQSVGTIALIKAIDKFDVSRNVKLSTLAYLYIKSALVVYLGKVSGAYTLPSHVIRVNRDAQKKGLKNLSRYEVNCTTAYRNACFPVELDALDFDIVEDSSDNNPYKDQLLSVLTPVEYETVMLRHTLPTKHKSFKRISKDLGLEDAQSVYREAVKKLKEHKDLFCAIL